MIGTGDLRISLRAEQDTDKLFHEYLDRTITSCLRRGIPYGIFATSDTDLKYFSEHGASFIVLADDISSYQNLVASKKTQFDKIKSTMQSGMDSREK